MKYDVYSMGKKKYIQDIQELYHHSSEIIKFWGAGKPPLSSAPNDHKSLSMAIARSPAHLASSGLLVQPALTLYFFFLLAFL